MADGAPVGGSGTFVLDEPEPPEASVAEVLGVASEAII
jgi:hypothetical protein